MMGDLSPEARRILIVVATNGRGKTARRTTLDGGVYGRGAHELIRRGLLQGVASHPSYIEVELTAAGMTALSDGPGIPDPPGWCVPVEVPE